MKARNDNHDRPVLSDALVDRVRDLMRDWTTENYSALAEGGEGDISSLVVRLLAIF